MKTLLGHIQESLNEDFCSVKPLKQISESFQGNGTYLISDDFGVTAFSERINFAALQKMEKEDDEMLTDVYFPEDSEIKITEIKGKKIHDERVYFVELIKLGKKSSIPADADEPKKGKKYLSTEYAVFGNAELLLVE